MYPGETRDDLEGLTPLKRAEYIAKNGPDPDAGPVPCEDEDTPTCFTFQELNRARYLIAECGCMFEGADRIGLCAAHRGAGPKVTYEEEENTDADGWMLQLVQGTAEMTKEIEEIIGAREDKD